MPSYEYHCKKGHYNLIERSVSEPEGKPTCTVPECSEELKRQYSVPLISFKGNGFYSTSK